MRGVPEVLPQEAAAVAGAGMPSRSGAVPTPRQPLADSPDDKDWDAALALLAGARGVLLVCHSRPDGDALGSALAVGLGLRSLGVAVEVSFDPLEVPASLAFLPGQDLLVSPDAVPKAPDLVVTFDSSSLDRLGVLAPKATAARALLVVDHHASNTRFGTHHLIDAAAAATAVLADELLTRLGVRLTADIATALYAGVASDTGSFKYAGTTPEVHALAGRLLATGIRHDLIGRSLWDTARFGYLKLLAAALERARLEPAAADGAGLVWTVVTRADRQRYGVHLDELEGVIDIVRKVAEADVAAVLKEDGEGTLVISLRSRGAIDVASVAGLLGGGGHALAAGFSASGTPEDVFARLRAALAETCGRPQGAPAPAAR